MATTYKTIKIDQLPSDDALSGNEVVPLQDGGQTKKATVNDIVNKVGFTDQLKQKITNAATQEDITQATANLLTATALDPLKTDITQLKAGQQNINQTLSTKANTSDLGSYATNSALSGLRSEVELKADASALADYATAVQLQQLTATVASKVDEAQARQLIQEGRDAFLKHDGSVALTGDLLAGGHAVKNLKNPDAPTDAATKQYVDTKVSEAAAGGASAVVKSLTQDVDGSGYTINNLKAPAQPSDAATKQYVDTKFESIPQSEAFDGDMKNARITNVGEPVAQTDAVRKQELDALQQTLSQSITNHRWDQNAQGNRITNVGEAAQNTDAVTKGQMEAHVTSKIGELNIPEAFTGDMKGKQLKNLGRSTSPNDAVTQEQLEEEVGSIQANLTASYVRKDALSDELVGFGAVKKDGSVAFVGNINAGSNAIKNLKNPEEGQDGATKAYVDQEALKAKTEAIGEIDGKVAQGIQTALQNVSEPQNPSHAANKGYVDQRIASVQSSGFTGDMANQRITNLGQPIAETDAARKAEVDAVDAKLTTLDQKALKKETDGSLNMSGKKITGLEDPSEDSDAVTYKVMNAGFNRFLGSFDGLLKDDGTNPMKANLNMGGFQLVNLRAPSEETDVTTKDYVDTNLNQKLDSADLEDSVSPFITAALKAVQEPETDTSAANKQYVDQKAQEVSGSIDQKIATHYTATVTPAINAAKFTGDMEDKKITNLNNPEAAQDAVNRRWAEANFLKRNNVDTMLVDLNMNSKKVINLSDPSQPQEAATKAYVDSKVGQGGGSANLPQANDKQTLMYDQGQWKAVDFTAGTINYVQSRDVGLITNGSGYLKNNYNFSAFTFDPSESYSGWGCFKITGRENDVKFDEFIPIDLDGEYEFKIAMRDCGTTANMVYSYLSCHDIDGEPIMPHHVPLVKFRLDAPLSYGDTQLIIDQSDKAAFNTFFNQRGTQSVNVCVFDGNYTSASGFKYPVGEYSRKQLNRNVQINQTQYNNTYGQWSGLNFNLTQFDTLPKGSWVYVGMSGGTYLYWIHHLAGQQLSKEWKSYTTRRYMKNYLRPWTAMVKLGILCNRGISSGQTTTTAISSMSFKQVERSQMLPETYELPTNLIPPCFISGSKLYADFYDSFYTLRISSRGHNRTTSTSRSSGQFPSALLPASGAFSIPYSHGNIWVESDLRLAAQPSGTGYSADIQSGPIYPRDINVLKPSAWTKV